MPWGDNNQKGPWGNPKPPSQEPPDFDELLRKGQEQLKNIFGGGIGGAKSFLLIVLVAVMVWMSTGFYQVEPQEVGVVLRFGEFNRQTEPGLNYHLPRPLERVIKVPVETINRLEIGMRSGSVSSRGGMSASATARKILEESIMLTGDKNIVDIGFIVQWKIKDAAAFLFNIREPDETVKSVAESAMREVVGQTPLAAALAAGKTDIETRTRQSMQAMLDQYESGIEVRTVQLRDVQPPGAVADAFRDVETAKQDRETSINEAQRESSAMIEIAKGQSERILREAEAYKEATVAKADGTADRFLSIYKEYQQAKDVTRRRMYLETMEEILGGMDKILIDNSAQGTGVVPYLPLKELNKGR